MNTTKRYFVFSCYHKGRHGGSSGTHYVITDGCFPSKRNLLSYFWIPSNDLSISMICEVKSVNDIQEFLERTVVDEVNYPLKRIYTESDGDY